MRKLLKHPQFDWQVCYIAIQQIITDDHIGAIQQSITRQYSRCLIILFMISRLTMTKIVIVDAWQIVVNQGKVVHHFDSYGKRQAPPDILTKQLISCHY